MGKYETAFARSCAMADSPPPPCSGDTLVQAACKVLKTGNPWKKEEYGALAVRLWQQGTIQQAYDEEEDGPQDAPPNHPARDHTVKVVPAREMGKRGKGGSLQSRQALLHSLVHIESWAIDLSWDIMARFGKRERMPREFFDDFVQVAAEEGRHFSMLAARLQEIGSHYGALPGHEGLWDSASETAGDLRARLAVEHCVHEARGLDVVPQTISRFRAGGDAATAELLESVIYPEEITHCAAGVKWFTFLCQRDLADLSLKAERESKGALKNASARQSETLAMGGGEEDAGPWIPRLAEEREREDNGDAIVSRREDLSAGKLEKESCEEPSLGSHCRGGESNGQPFGEDERDATGVLSIQSVEQRGKCYKEQRVTGCDAVSNLKSSGSDVLATLQTIDLRPSHSQAIVQRFHEIVRRHFRGPLKPPFNEAARAKAGFGPEWYLPLATGRP